MEQELGKVYWTEEELALVLHMSLGTVRNRYSLKLLMPPYIQIPGARLKLFDPGAVRAWMSMQTVSVEPKRRRGRPPKSVNQAA